MTDLNQNSTPASDCSTPLTELIHRAGKRDKDASSELYERVYDGLYQAARRVIRGKSGLELQPTDLVNEVVLRFENYGSLSSMANRRVFFSVAIRAMHQIVIDHYRRRKKCVDGGGRTTIPLDEAINTLEQSTGANVEDLNEALEGLASESPRQYSVILHRFYGGLTIAQTAELLEVSPQTIERDWRLARAKLFRRLHCE